MAKYAQNVLNASYNLKFQKKLGGGGKLPPTREEVTPTCSVCASGTQLSPYFIN